ncbi:hypothetical protein [Alkalicoccobacillus porphyridii]|uniref:Uncharacterized protein n=1 Tax=Alkalicoccobacillus porphyridii TaxID=2597270 RepID=A0A554A0V4_9BACI|nr:hypothetical protein [Alkalicoccobacillus porphyridii]TSB47321.1 hypothetical protein FN960_06165 [Alkalicoccobacillus porphyridii]
MAEYLQYISEKQEIEQLLEQGYQIYNMRDHLNGTDVLMKKPEESELVTLVLGNANARKYLTTILSLQLANERRLV